jgi:predicted GIY-YIG superfamily endonuclease
VVVGRKIRKIKRKKQKAKRQKLVKPSLAFLYRMENEWIVYCLATVEPPYQTYIGATIDKDRRLRQHNGILKGGARATSRRPGEWYRVCYVEGFQDSHSALSFEWHWKHFTRRLKNDRSKSSLERRQAALQVCMEWAEEQWPDIELEVME